MYFAFTVLRADKQACLLYTSDVYPSVPFLALIDKFRGQVDGILVLHEPCFLHEALIGGIEPVSYTHLG